MQSNEFDVDWTINQDWHRYTEQDHAVWRRLFERQTSLLPGLACNAFVLGMQQLPMAADQIPNFEKLSDALERQTGWRVVAVPGLLPDSVFFDHLAHRRFPAGRFIRQAKQLDYLQEPDIFHDVFGHVPMLMHPIMADFMQLYGQDPYLRSGHCIVLHRKRICCKKPLPQSHSFRLRASDANRLSY